MRSDDQQIDFVRRDELGDCVVGRSDNNLDLHALLESAIVGLRQLSVQFGLRIDVQSLLARGNFLLGDPRDQQVRQGILLQDVQDVESGVQRAGGLDRGVQHGNRGVAQIGGDGDLANLPILLGLHDPDRAWREADQLLSRAAEQQPRRRVALPSPHHDQIVLVLARLFGQFLPRQTDPHRLVRRDVACVRGTHLRIEQFTRDIPDRLEQVLVIAFDQRSRLRRDLEHGTKRHHAPRVGGEFERLIDGRPRFRTELFRDRPVSVVQIDADQDLQVLRHDFHGPGQRSKIDPRATSRDDPNRCEHRSDYIAITKRPSSG